MIDYRTHNRRVLLGATATSYLVLAVAFGPERCWLFIGLATWVYLCCRWPHIFMTITFAFLSGIISGLFNSRNNYYPRYYRRRSFTRR
jgi:hypothetical protein